MRNDTFVIMAATDKPRPARARPNYTFVTDPDSRCYAVVWSGDVTLDALKAFYVDVVKLPEFPDRRGVLHDFRNADIAHDFNELDKVREHYRQAIRDHDVRPGLSFIVKSSHQFGQVRQTIAKMLSNDQILVTYSEDEAKTFIGLPTDFDLTAGT